jgi:uncharacterized protein (TIGR02186 family)
LLAAAGAAVLYPAVVLPLQGWETTAEAQQLKGTEKRKVRRSRRKPAPAQTPAAPPEAAPAVRREPGREREPAPAPAPPSTATAALLPREKVEADVSTRSIAVTSEFTGTEIIVFGSVDNSRQPSPESGYYDVAVIVEGSSTPLVVRRKSRVGGLWINTDAASFVSVPSYYAITSTRPLEEIAEPSILTENAIGLKHVRLTPSTETGSTLSGAELEDYKAAIVRLKEQSDLYFTDDYGVAFIGRSLFRSSIELPPNVPVGPLSARVYLFHDGELLSEFSTRVELQREGIELVLYRFATNYSLLYGLFAVLVASGAGLLASAVFRRPIQ